MSQKENVPYIERLASFFRRPIKHRSKMSLNILDRFVKDKTVLELGCGSGYFAFELLQKSKVKHVTGIDISHNAIVHAKKIATERQLSEKITFLEGDVPNVTLPEVDVTIGLGFLDYLSPEEIKLLFSTMRSSSFLFSFSERRVSLFRYIHILYMLSQGCSKHFYYTRDEIAGYIGKEYRDMQFLCDRKLSFACIVHNLP